MAQDTHLRLTKMLAASRMCLSQCFSFITMEKQKKDGCERLFVGCYGRITTLVKL